MGEVIKVNFGGPREPAQPAKQADGPDTSSDDPDMLAALLTKLYEGIGVDSTIT